MAHFFHDGDEHLVQVESRGERLTGAVEQFQLASALLQRLFRLLALCNLFLGLFIQSCVFNGNGCLDC